MYGNYSQVEGKPSRNRKITIYYDNDDQRSDVGRVCLLNFKEDKDMWINTFR